MKLASLLAGCALLFGCQAPTGLDLNLTIDNVLFSSTATAVVVLSSDKGFPAADPTPVPGLSGVTVGGFDYYGDGTNAVVIQFDRSYPLTPGDKVNHFELVPNGLTDAMQVQVRAELYDDLHRLLAFLPQDKEGNDFVLAQLQPGTISSVDVEPKCAGTSCSTATLASPLITDPVGKNNGQIDTPADIGAVVAATITGGAGHSDLIASAPFAHYEPTQGFARPAAGRVRLFEFPNFTAGGDADLVGGQAGDQLGAGMAAGDLDGDGRDDLVVGATGVSDGAGAVYLLLGSSQWWKNPLIDFGCPTGVDLRRIVGPPALHTGDAGTVQPARFGATVAIGDGPAGKVVLVGAPEAALGNGAVFVFSLADFEPYTCGGMVDASMNDTMDGGAPVDGGGAPQAMAWLTGRAGSRLGKSLAAVGGRFAVGAPFDPVGGSPKGAVYFFQAADLATSHRADDLGRWVGEGGGFGDSVSIASTTSQFDGGADSLALLAGAPDQGAGGLFVLSGDAFLQDGSVKATGDVSTVSHAVSGTAPTALFGAALARAPRGHGGDVYLVGAPHDLPSASSPDGGTGAMALAGAVYLFGANTVGAAPALILGSTGDPAFGAAFGQVDHEAFGAQLTVGQFDMDKELDLAVAASGSQRVYLFLSSKGRVF